MSHIKLGERTPQPEAGSSAVLEPRRVKLHNLIEELLLVLLTQITVQTYIWQLHIAKRYIYLRYAWTLIPHTDLQA